MNTEDSCVYMSRFSKETWDNFVCSRKPTQVVCNLHKAQENLPCMEIDVKSCRFLGVTEGNCSDIPVFSPLDEFRKPKPGYLADYNWVDIGHVRSPLTNYIFDGPRWYDKQTVQFMMATGVCKWGDVLLQFDASVHRPASCLLYTSPSPRD